MELAKKTIDAAVDAGADAVALVAAMPSGPGQISDAEIAAIAASTPPPISTFLLTARTTADGISEHVDATRPTTVQIVSHIEEAEAAEEECFNTAFHPVVVIGCTVVFLGSAE